MAKKNAHRRQEVRCFKPIGTTVSANLEFLQSYRFFLSQFYTFLKKKHQFVINIRIKFNAYSLPDILTLSFYSEF